MSDTSPARTRIRLVALDVDGTLLTSAHEVTERTREAVERAVRAGVRVVLASSRGAAAMPSVLRDLTAGSARTLRLDVVAAQGAVTGTWSDGSLRLHRRVPVPVPLARAVAGDALRAGLAVSWYSGTRWYVSHVDATIERESHVVRTRPTVADLTTLPDEPDKLMVIGAAEATASLRDWRDRLPAGLLAQTSNPAYVEVTAAGVDKARAVAELCDACGVPREAVLAVGDGPNDVAMLRWAGRSVAPSTGSAEALAVAQLTAAGNDEDGVAQVLETLLGGDAR